MMYRVLSCLLLFISFVSCDLPIFSQLFKDPYTVTSTQAPYFSDALLDIDVDILCPELAVISVIIPQQVNTQNNAYFSGPTFGPRLINGVSKHAGINGGNTYPTTAWVAWDDTTKTITFSGFSAGVFAPTFVNYPVGNPDPTWYNFNFDIPDYEFVDPTAPGFSDDGKHVPLLLVPAGGVQPTGALYITLNDPNDFEANISPDGVCRRGSSVGDPVFSGFQGQQFQFHGLPDEYFNLVSSPNVQLNSHFVYLSSGKCDYNDTECYTHPGTYMDVLGLSVAETHIKLVAGTHEAGLRVWLNDIELKRGARIPSLSTNTTASLRYHHNGHIEIHTDIMMFEIVNSDMFMNIRVGLNDLQLLRVGSTRHTVTDKAICKTNSETNNHQLIESTVAAKYSVTTPLHGLIGQTWRNVKVCGRDWMGTVQDYLVSDLFANDSHYSFFKW